MYGADQANDINQHSQKGYIVQDFGSVCIPTARYNRSRMYEEILKEPLVKLFALLPLRCVYVLRKLLKHSQGRFFDFI